MNFIVCTRPRTNNQTRVIWLRKRTAHYLKFLAVLRRILDFKLKIEFRWFIAPVRGIQTRLSHDVRNMNTLRLSDRHIFTQTPTFENAVCS